MASHMVESNEDVMEGEIEPKGLPVRTGQPRLVAASASGKRDDREGSAWHAAIRGKLSRRLKRGNSEGQARSDQNQIKTWSL